MNKIPEEQKKYQISLPRKILIGIFIILFWIFYYGYKTDTVPPPQLENSSESSSPEETEPAGRD